MGCCTVSTNKGKNEQENEYYNSDNECSTSHNETIYGKRMKSFKNRPIIIGHVMDTYGYCNNIIHTTQPITTTINPNNNNTSNDIYYKVKQTMDEHENEYEYNSETPTTSNVNIVYDMKQNREFKTNNIDSFNSSTQTLTTTQTNYDNKNINIPFSMYNSTVLLTPTSTELNSRIYSNNPYLISSKLPPLKTFTPQGTTMFNKRIKTRMTPPPPIEPPPPDIISKYSKMSSTKTLSSNILFNNNNSYNNNIHLMNNINALNNEYYYETMTVPHIIDDTSTIDKSSFLTLPKSETKTKTKTNNRDYGELIFINPYGYFNEIEGSTNDVHKNNNNNMIQTPLSPQSTSLSTQTQMTNEYLDSVWQQEAD